MSRSVVRVRIGDTTHDLEPGPKGSMTVPGQAELVITPVGRGEYLVTSGDTHVTAWVAPEGDRRWVFIEGETYEIEIVPRDTGRPATGPHQEAVTAPMPATVLKIVAEAGAIVSEGDTLIILEAMKMELPLRATRAGTVRAINCREGELVQPGVVLVEIA